MLTYALIGGAIAVGGLLMGKYYGKKKDETPPPKDE